MLSSALSTLPPHAVLGHRGNRAHSPENTLFSMREAVALGVHGLEFDVRLSRDGELIVMHDPRVDRTTDGTGAIAELTWEQIRHLDAGARFSVDHATFPHRGRGIGVPRLIDVLEAFPGLPLIIEIKVPEAAAAVRRLLLEHEATSHCTVAAFRHDTMRPFADSPIPRCASTIETTRMYLPALFGRRYRALPFQAMSLPPRHHGIPVPLGALAAAAAPTGVPVTAWTINEPAVALRLWSRGVRAVLSDDPGAMLRVRAQIGARAT
ncbi:MAG: glycerophosphodiester phosphodiesterase family protein [Gemmatimonadaceae bacterium]